ncbi:FUSC family protein [Francisella sp. LA112445]|uniref:FUSC family protein n=1 Tax=Francisella sp. LA112445 TaxID=1395624 RepID=UPI001788DC22|nr:FUSC family protein [Francisella sp. LA112445]QIW10577.1 FUSC family protein [Francisella sp. LA112445]
MKIKYKNLDLLQLCKNIYISFEIAIAACLCFLFGFYVSNLLHGGQSIIGGFWCLITVSTILQLSVKDSYSAAFQIFVGSVIGGITAFIFTSIFGYYYLVMILAVAISVFITASIGLENAVKMSSANAGVIVALGLYQPTYSPFVNTGLRLIETFSGTAIALFFIFISRIFKIRTS